MENEKGEKTEKEGRRRGRHSHWGARGLPIQAAIPLGTTELLNSISKNLKPKEEVSRSFSALNPKLYIVISEDLQGFPLPPDRSAVTPWATGADPSWSSPPPC